MVLWTLGWTDSLRSVMLLPDNSLGLGLIGFAGGPVELLLNPADHFELLWELSLHQTEPNLPQSQKTDPQD